MSNNNRKVKNNMENNKTLVRNIKNNTEPGKKRLTCSLFRRAHKTHKHILRMTEGENQVHVLSKRTFGLLSPWNTRMVKIAIKQPFDDLKNALPLVAGSEVTTQELLNIYQNSSQYKRLAEAKIHDSK